MLHWEQTHPTHCSALGAASHAGTKQTKHPAWLQHLCSLVLSLHPLQPLLQPSQSRALFSTLISPWVSNPKALPQLTHSLSHVLPSADLTVILCVVLSLGTIHQRTQLCVAIPEPCSPTHSSDAEAVTMLWDGDALISKGLNSCRPSRAPHELRAAPGLAAMAQWELPLCTHSLQPGLSGLPDLQQHTQAGI